MYICYGRLRENVPKTPERFERDLNIPADFLSALYIQERPIGLMSCARMELAPAHPGSGTPTAGPYLS